jgi:hypothetical protein
MPKIDFTDEERRALADLAREYVGRSAIRLRRGWRRSRRRWRNWRQPMSCPRRPASGNSGAIRCGKILRRPRYQQLRYTLSSG